MGDGEGAQANPLNPPDPPLYFPGCIAPLESPIKGDVRISGSLLGLSESLRYEFGSTATYSCDQGYRLVGGTNPRHCEDTSSWSGDAPTCDPISMYDYDLIQMR